jgi:cyclopropane fatty-acyl-phospholipid synthase-like methyltransferase
MPTNALVTDYSDLDEARYADMRWNTPLSEEHATLLVERLGVSSGEYVVDLGCGWGELLLRAIEAGGAETMGTGVDTDVQALRRGQALAAGRGLAGRVTFREGDAAAWRDPADRLLCIGASHAWGGTENALVALAEVVAPGGTLLFGDGCWENPPTPAAAALFEGEVLPLQAVVEHAHAARWRILHLSTADQREWDDFEATWRAGRQRWLIKNPCDERATHVRSELDEQLRDYVTAYRGVLGFSYLVLGR